MKKQILTKKLNFLSGFGFIDVLVGTALVSLVFLGIFGLIQLGIRVVGQSKAKITALAIANEKIETTRNLPYESVGIIGGFPEGVLEETTTLTQNNILYTIETRVDYVVDEADGIAAPDDECPNDYKKVEFKVSWSGRFEGDITLVTDIVPKNLAQECADEGGILSISVFDAYGLMVPSPLIEIKDPLTDQLITSATPDDGQHYFSLESSAYYKVVVSKAGFSSERTYGNDEITHPKKPHFLVVEDELTEASFSIDETSTFSINTLSPWGEDYFSDSFTDTTKISESSNIVVSEGKANLVKTAGIYFKEGIEDSDLCAFPGTEGDCGQSFTMGSQQKQISQVKLYIRKATSNPSNIYLEIRSSTTTGTVIASSAELIGSDLPINLDWITFNLTNPVTLSASIQYFLRLRSTPDSTDPDSGAQGSVLWGYASSSPSTYDGGEGWRYIAKNNNPSDSGEKLEAVDFSFIIYEDEYALLGYLISNSITPASLSNWNEFSWGDSEPLNTDLKYQIYYATDTNWQLIPDSALSGNSAGFDISPINLSGLSTATYFKLKLRANLSTNDIGLSPTLYNWQLSWITDLATPIPNIDFLVTGAKAIGTDINEDPVYKYSATSTSDGSGYVNVSNLEWDLYTFSISPTGSLDLVDTDPSPQPINLPPDNATQNVSLYLEANNSLLITIQNNETIEPIFAASVRVYNSGLSYDTTQYTNEKGQTYFIPLEAATYNLEVEASGYLSTLTTASVSGDVTKTIRLEQIE